MQLKKKDTQSQQVKPTYALIIAPSKDFVLEPTGVFLPACSNAFATRECLYMRCTESNCPYRQTKIDANTAVAIPAVPEPTQRTMCQSSAMLMVPTISCITLPLQHTTF